MKSRRSKVLVTVEEFPEMMGREDVNQGNNKRDINKENITNSVNH